MANNFLIDEAKNLIQGVDKKLYTEETAAIVAKLMAEVEDRKKLEENLLYALASSFIYTSTGTIKNALMGITDFNEYTKRVTAAGYTLPDLSILGDFYDSDSSYRYSYIGDKPMKSLQNAYFGTNFLVAFEDFTDLLEIRTIRLPNANNVGGMFDSCSNLKSVEALYLRDEKFEVYPDFESYYDLMAYSKTKSDWQVELHTLIMYNNYGLFSRCSSLEHIGHIDMTNGVGDAFFLNGCTKLTTFPDSQVTGRYWNQVITTESGNKYYPNTELLSDNAWLYGMTHVKHFNDDPLTEHPWNFVRSFDISGMKSLDYESLIKIINGVVYSEGTAPDDRVMTVCGEQRDKLTSADVAVLEGKGFTIETD